MMTIKISTLEEFERALPILRKLESLTSSYIHIRNNLPRFIFIHLSPRRGHTWTHGKHSNYYNYPLLDVSTLHTLEETNPELFL